MHRCRALLKPAVCAATSVAAFYFLTRSRTQWRVYTLFRRLLSDPAWKAVETSSTPTSVCSWKKQNGSLATGLSASLCTSDAAATSTTAQGEVVITKALGAQPQGPATVAAVRTRPAIAHSPVPQPSLTSFSGEQPSDDDGGSSAPGELAPAVESFMEKTRRMILSARADREREEAAGSQL